jgi:hypothetical protein
MSARLLRSRQASGTVQTATFSTPDIPFDEDWLQLFINVTAVSGAGATMVITLEGKDEDGAYVTLATLAGITAVSKVPASFGTDTPNPTLLPRTLRLTFTITGATPSFTVSYSAYGGRIGN